MKRMLLLITLFFVLIPSAINAASNESLQQARRLFENAKYSEAASAFKNIVDQHPSSPEAPVAAYYLGLTAERLGHRSAAIDAYKKMISSYGSSSDLTSFARQRLKELESNVGLQSGNGGSEAQSSSGTATAVSNAAQEVIKELQTRAVPSGNERTVRRVQRRRENNRRTEVRTGRNWPGSEDSSRAEEFPALLSDVYFPDRFVQTVQTVVTIPSQSVSGMRVVTFPESDEQQIEISNEAVIYQSTSEAIPAVSDDNRIVPTRTPDTEARMPVIALQGTSVKAPIGNVIVRYERRPTGSEREIEYALSGGREEGSTPIYQHSEQPAFDQQNTASTPIYQHSEQPAFDQQTAASISQPQSLPWWDSVEPQKIKLRIAVTPTRVPLPANIVGTDYSLLRLEDPSEMSVKREEKVVIPKIELNVPVLSLAEFVRSELEIPEEKPVEVVEEKPVEEEISSGDSRIVFEEKTEEETVVESIPVVPQQELRGLDSIASLTFQPVSVSSLKEQNNIQTTNGMQSLPSSEIVPVVIGSDNVSIQSIAIEPQIAPIPVSVEKPLFVPEDVIYTPDVISDFSIQNAATEMQDTITYQPVVQPFTADESLADAAGSSQLPPPLYNISLDSIRSTVISEVGIEGRGTSAGKPIVRLNNVPDAGNRAVSKIEGHIIKALEYRKLGAADKAIEEYRQALALDHSNPIVRNNLADIFVEKGENLEEAIELVKGALESGVQNKGPYYSTLGWAYAKSGDLINAEKFMNEALKLGITSWRLYRRAMIYAAMGMVSRARADLDKAMVYSEDVGTTAAIRKAYEDIENNLPIQGSERIIR